MGHSNTFHPIYEEDDILQESPSRAIEMIMDTYGDEIKRLVFTYMKNNADTDDVTQEIFVTVYKKLDTFQRNSALKSWIYSIAINKCKDYLRSWHARNKRLKEKLSLAAQTSEDTSITPEEFYLKQNEERFLFDQVMSLPIKYREVIILFYFKELSTKEISHVLGLKEATIRTRLARGRDKLKDCLSQKEVVGTMDKQLKNLKTQYEEQITTSFTAQDKKAVFEKIQASDKKVSGRRFPYLPQVLTGVVIAAIIFIGVISFQSIPDMFISYPDQSSESSDDSDTVEMEMYSTESSDEEESISTADEDRPEIIANRSEEAHFDPHTVEVGASYGNFTITDVNKQDTQTSIVFEGETWLSGSFNIDEEEVMFQPNDEYLAEFPLSTVDQEGDLSFYFQNEEYVQQIYNDTEQQGSSSTMKEDIMLHVVGVEYIYSPESSKVLLDIQETESN